MEGPSMIFDSNHLNEKLDSLSIDDKNGRNQRSDSGTERSRSSDIEDHISENKRSSADYGRKTRKSLLSSSLAGESHRYENEDGSRPLASRRDGAGHGVEIPSRDHLIVDEHPEPELLASSVGKEVDGIIVPLSSTISLLSLNNQSLNAHQDDYEAAQSHSGMPTQIQYGGQAGQMHTMGAPVINHPQTIHIDRKTPYNNLGSLSSRTSLSQLSSRRYQPYHKFCPPSVGQPVAQQEVFYSQAIPIDGKHMRIPESPNLNPTSLGGSPSRFWLTNQTPPRFMNDAHGHTGPQNLQFNPIHNHPQSSAYNFSYHRNDDMKHPNMEKSRNYTLTPSSSYIKIGSDISPVLNPVQTPLEDPPMTPLRLNASAFANQQGYFENLDHHRLESYMTSKSQSQTGDDHEYDNDVDEYEIGINIDDV